MGGEQRVAYAEGEAYGHTVAFRVRQGKLSGRLAVGVLNEAALAGGVVLHPVISAQIGDAFQKAAFLAHALAPDGHRVERIAVCEGLRIVALVQEFRLQVKVAQPGKRPEVDGGVGCLAVGYHLVLNARDQTQPLDRVELDSCRISRGLEPGAFLVFKEFAVEDASIDGEDGPAVLAGEVITNLEAHVAHIAHLFCYE